MKFGMCAKSAYSKIKSAGFDYGEIPLAKTALLSDDEFLAFKDELSSCGLVTDVANLFLPGDLNVVDGTKTEEDLRAYAHLAFSRFKELGGKLAVWGSAGQRRVPEDIPLEVGYQRFVSAVKIFCGVAKDYGITIAVEPLKRSDTNLINTLGDALKLCLDVNLSNFGTIADTYHLFMNGEEVSEIYKIKDYLKHIHIARRNPDRKMPHTPQDIEDLKEVAKVLKDIGYDERISLECGMVPDFDTGLKTIRETLKIFE